MINYIGKFGILVVLMICFTTQVNAQNKNFIVSLGLGAGNSGFKIDNKEDDELKRIFYPTGGIQIQKRINSNWAINIYPNVGMSGNKRRFKNPNSAITELRSTSAFVNLGLHPKYYLNDNVYFSLGPEFSYLLWNYGSTYVGDERQSNIKETDFFNRTNLLVSSSIGLSKKVDESRKNAPVQIDVLWFLEFRIKKGITNILNKDIFGDNISSRTLSFELVTGFSFASKK